MYCWHECEVTTAVDNEELKDERILWLEVAYTSCCSDYIDTGRCRS